MKVRDLLEGNRVVLDKHQGIAFELTPNNKAIALFNSNRDGMFDYQQIKQMLGGNSVNGFTLDTSGGGDGVASIENGEETYFAPLKVLQDMANLTGR